jgi:hypothetical protein
MDNKYKEKFIQMKKERRKNALISVLLMGKKLFLFLKKF